ncbi:sce7725 family protein [Pseudomonas sp. H11T01]|uniref:sce7725 family protein n=1 Tax=Pseudomonas sp. H11T01 TaxID=3402749 RepID=UPI003AD6D781
MYYPILRGKQNELIALRELSELVAANVLKPVIEPVRASIAPLERTIKQLASKGILPLVVVNPSLGDFLGGHHNVSGNLESVDGMYVPCVKIKGPTDANAIELFKTFSGTAAVYLENGVDQPLIDVVNSSVCTLVNEQKLNKVAFERLSNKVVYGDFFDKQSKNSDYEEYSYFPGLHSEYKTRENVVGFGDFTILSEEYSESGGPAYVVTIHLSYINRAEFDSMHVRHFSSYDDRSPANPGGKFKDALNKLIAFVRDNPGKITATSGLAEFIGLSASGHFPGLGFVKKVSVKHHIETTCSYVGEL